MNTTAGPAHSADAPSRQEELSFLFAQLVLQQSNMAMMLMGKVAHPESGKVVHDVDAARLFIDQLEMLETKTKGNLSKEEEHLLKQTLMSLRLNFVETVETSGSAPSQQPKVADASADQAQAAEPMKARPDSTPSGSEEDEHRKKFSKKY
jgi:hypothetical protein